MQLGMSEQMVSAFADTFGNCAQELEHRGPVTFAGPDPAPIGTPGITDGYALNIDQGSTFNNQGDSIFQGNNLFDTPSVTTFLGEVNLDGDTTFTGDTTFDGDTTFHGAIDFNGSTPTGDWVGKTKVNSSDSLAYLEDQMADGHVQASAQYNATDDVKIEVDTIDSAGDKKLRFFWDLSDQSGYSGSGKNAWIIESGAPKFISPTALTPQTITPTTVTPTTVTPTGTTVVTDVAWDEETCEMTKTTATIYQFPGSSAINVFPNNTAINVFPNNSNRFGFPSATQINYFAG